MADQAERLNTWLHKNILNVIVTREPTDGPIGAQCRLALNKRFDIPDFAQAVLLLSDRLDHLYRSDGIIEDIQKGKYIVCIHYLLSTYAYPYKKVPMEWLQKINRKCRWPDLVIFIDTPVDSVLERQARREGYDIELWQQKKELLEEQRERYYQAIEHCQKDGKQTSIIDGNKPADSIQRLCLTLVKNLGVKK